MPERAPHKSCIESLLKGIRWLHWIPLVMGLCFVALICLYLEWATNKGTLLDGLNYKIICNLAPTEHRKSLFFNKTMIELPTRVRREPQLYMVGGSATGVFFRQKAIFDDKGTLRMVGVPNYQFQALIQSNSSMSILSLIADSLPATPSAIIIIVSRYAFGRAPSPFILSESRLILGKATTLMDIYKEKKGNLPNYYTFKSAWPRSLIMLGRLYTQWINERLPSVSTTPNVENPEQIKPKNIAESEFRLQSIPSFDRFFEEDKAIFLRTLKVLNQKGIKVVLFELPISPNLISLRPDQVARYDAFSEQFSALPGVSYIDVLKHQTITDDDFTDGIHFTEAARSRLMPASLSELQKVLNHSSPGQQNS